MASYVPGDLGCSSGRSLIDRAIQFGQRCAGAPPGEARWNHAFVIVDTDGTTVEASARGVIRGQVEEHGDRLIVPAPEGVERHKVVNFAMKQVGLPYDFVEICLLGIDCLHRTWNLHRHSRAWICSELAAASWIAGGWASPRCPAMTYPWDIAAEAGTRVQQDG